MGAKLICGSGFDSMALGCRCGLIDLVVGCSGLCCGLRLWVVSCVEAVGSPLSGEISLWWVWVD